MESTILDQCQIGKSIRGYLFNDLNKELIQLFIRIVNYDPKDGTILNVRYGNADIEHTIVLSVNSTFSDLLNLLYSHYFNTEFRKNNSSLASEIDNLTPVYSINSIRLQCKSDLVEGLVSICNSEQPTIIIDKFDSYCAVFCTKDITIFNLLAFIDCELLKDCLFFFEKYKALIQKDLEEERFKDILKYLDLISLELQRHTTLNSISRNFLREICIYFKKLNELNSLPKG